MKSVIYGIHAAKSRLKSAPESIEQVLVQSGKQDNAKLSELLGMIKSKNIHYSFVERAQLDLRSDGGVHQGIVMLCQPCNNLLDEQQALDLIENNAMPLVLILDGITDPHNLGACLRTAAAINVTCVVMPKDKSAPINATVSKVASGAAEMMPMSYVTNLARFIDQLKALGVWIMGLAGEANESIYQQDFNMPLAVVMGSEGKGLRMLTRKKCDYLIKLPMEGDIESLNVSVAAGVTLYEVYRQRLG
ncbi:23S rRNA (guanosine(2251)-2'-O)-methyltransferase RlmB [Thiotrichales bacterium 19S3-7]|nr:23S rRNA (guanosine(2251)-2'-O)-methyltransferase RlmB [Thiotrichales bacterium 19S3-7]MCF6801212.1 23S rRNA (guanosine(2251)-2'-O)-methyltransferase RlmB [Thiotrichales bacterium 19S3-11]